MIFNINSAFVKVLIMNEYFERSVYNEMLRWKEELAPRYALFLKGARRVGKTTLAEKLGRERYKSYILVRFDQAEDEVKDLFVNSLRDLDSFFQTLQFSYGTRLYERESLVILDEIQLFPLARQALKTLLEDGRYDYLETGSLAGIEKKSKDILIPSEEHHVEVLPMSFSEYLAAMGDDMTMEVIEEHFSSLKPLGGMHQRIMKKFREYMLVGGMPQAVAAFAEGKDFGQADYVKQQIINLYRADMDAQEEENPTYVTNFFDRIPSELSKHDKRYVLSHVDPNARIRDYRGPIRWLEEAMVANIASNVDDPSVAFNLGVIDPSFKCYLMDTGLLVSLAYRDRPYLENELYKAILLDKLHVNEGMIVENAVAQALRTEGHALFFYRKADPDTRKTVMEIDFLVRQGGKVCPVEVKSGGSKSLKSLTRFKEALGNKVGTSYVLHAGEIKREEGIVFLPYYMASKL